MNTSVIGFVRRTELDRNPGEGGGGGGGVLFPASSAPAAQSSVVGAIVSHRASTFDVRVLTVIRDCCTLPMKVEHYALIGFVSRTQFHRMSCMYIYIYITH